MDGALQPGAHYSEITGIVRFTERFIQLMYMQEIMNDYERCSEIHTIEQV